MKAKIIPADTSNVLLPYQCKWIHDHSRLKIAEKSRQIGWTWATACGLVLRKCRRQARYDAWIASRDELQAKLFVDDCKHFAGDYHVAAEDLGVAVVDDHGHSAYVLALANGLRLNKTDPAFAAPAIKITPTNNPFIPTQNRL